MIIAGLATVGIASMWMSGRNLGVSPGMVISPRNFQTGPGAGMMFVPLNLAAYAFIPKDQVNNARASSAWWPTRAPASASPSRTRCSSAGPSSISSD